MTTRKLYAVKFVVKTIIDV